MWPTVQTVVIALLVLGGMVLVGSGFGWLAYAGRGGRYLEEE